MNIKEFLKSKKKITAKDKYVSVILTFLIVGFGHFYLREWKRGFVWIAGIVPLAVIIIILFGENYQIIWKIGFLFRVICGLDAWMIATGKKEGLFSIDEKTRNEIREIIETIRKFLKFKKRKMILPCFLIIIFVLFSFLFASESVFVKYVDEEADYIFNMIKAEKYGDAYLSFNETEKADEMNRTAERINLKSIELEMKVESESGLAEYIIIAEYKILGSLSPFSCLGKNIGNYYMLCPSWNSKFTYELSDILCKIYVIDKYELAEVNSTEQLEQIIAMHPAEKNENCEDYAPERFRAEYKKIISKYLEINSLIAGTLAVACVLILFIVGYLISCTIFFVWDYFMKGKFKALIKRK